MKMQQVILAIVAFLVVLVVSIYPLHLIAVELFPGSGTMVHYGLPELLGLILAILAATVAWNFAGRQAGGEPEETADKKADKRR